MPSEKSETSKHVLVLFLISVLTSLQLIGSLKIILVLLERMKENSKDSLQERQLLLNKLLSKDPMTFQILQSERLSYEEGNVRNDDESELAKTGGYVEETGEPSFDFDFGEDLKDLGITTP